MVFAEAKKPRTTWDWEAAAAQVAAACMHSSQKVQVLSERGHYGTRFLQPARRWVSFHGWATRMNDGDLEEDGSISRVNLNFSI